MRDAVILLDPSYNPDGLSRFTHWANMHRGRQLVADPAHREHTEAWPQGRYNHYWFDLNRDWLLVQHPESQGRLEVFHAWKPNVLTDHHEMQSHRTFFFQPGIPSRNNPLTPARTFELTAQIAEYHAAALDQLGSLYYTKESFDDFYVGKGSTYPDINGTIGILFEQASVRGHLQQNPHGERTFAFAVRNQVATSLSTLAAVRQLRVELLTHQRDFYTTALTEADELQVKGYVFGADDDAARLHHFMQLLHTHRIQVHELTRSIDAGGDTFTPSKAWVVPVRQPQQRLVRALFERRTSFSDSVFYDVSTWTMPLAFDLPYAELKGRAWRQDLAGNQVKAGAFPQGELDTSANPYAYAFSWKDYYAPRAPLQASRWRYSCVCRDSTFRRPNQDWRAVLRLWHDHHSSWEPSSRGRLHQSAAASDCSAGRTSHPCPQHRPDLFGDQPGVTSIRATGQARSRTHRR